MLFYVIVLYVVALQCIVLYCCYWRNYLNKVLEMFLLKLILVPHIDA